VAQEQISEVNDIMLIQKLRAVSEKNQEDHVEQMMRILYDGASHQYSYQNALKDEENEFYDI
jgi:hypothetical protein